MENRSISVAATHANRERTRPVREGLPPEIASEYPRLLRGFATRDPALVLDTFMGEAMHQGLQISVELLRPVQVILRSFEEYADSAPTWGVEA
jgi:hypothetical protein